MEDIFGNIEMGTVVSCPVCRDNYNLTDRYPVNIQCGHTFCFQCAQALLPPGSTVLLCPVCRKRHHGMAGKTASSFPKNYQLLEVIEKVVEIKRKSDDLKSIRRIIKCRDCKNDTPEDSCTQCSCVKDLSNEDLDFMGRSRNLLICVECINKDHREHDVKPMNIVKAAFDNFKIDHDLTEFVKRIKARTESTKSALNNSKEELDTLINVIDNTMTRIRSKPKDATLYCTVSKYFNRLETIEKSIASLGTQAHVYATTLGSHCDNIKDFGLHQKPKVIPPPEEPGRDVLPRPLQRDENVRLVVRFAELADAEGNARLQDIVNQAQADEQNDHRRPLPINVDERVVIFNDMLRGVFRVIEDVAADPAENEGEDFVDDVDDVPNLVENGNVIEHVAAAEENPNDQLNNDGNMAGAMEVVEEVADVVPVIEPADQVIQDEVDPVVEPVVQPAPRQHRPRGRPAAVPAVVEPEVRDEGPARRRGRGRPPRHDPIHRDIPNRSMNARALRAARRN